MTAGYFFFSQLITGTNAADGSADINFLRHGSKKIGDCPLLALPIIIERGISVSSLNP